VFQQCSVSFKAREPNHTVVLKKRAYIRDKGSNNYTFHCHVKNLTTLQPVCNSANSTQLLALLLHHFTTIFMVALCNRADNYIFAL